MSEYSQFSTYYHLLRQKRPKSGSMRCGECQYWYPDDLYPSLGQCQRRDSQDFQKAFREDRASGSCFEERSLSSEVFCWCKKCRETIPVSEVPAHLGHNIYVGTARIPVEEMAELTFAGD